MPWRQLIFTADGIIWPAWPAIITDSVRHEQALARARCISDEERVLLDLLEWTAAKKVQDVVLPEALISRRGSAASQASTPSISRCGSATMD